MQDDLGSAVDCMECGKTVDLEGERCFAITDEVVLCYTCSVRRGGAYDSADDKWVVAPRLGNLGRGEGEGRVPQP
jgi:hypothetical protein